MAGTIKEKLKAFECTPYLVLGLALIILVVFIAYPLSKVVFNSFIKLGDAPTLKNLTLANYSQFSTLTLFRSAFLNTLTVGLFCVPYNHTDRGFQVWFQQDDCTCYLNRKILLRLPDE